MPPGPGVILGTSVPVSASGDTMSPSGSGHLQDLHARVRPWTYPLSCKATQGIRETGSTCDAVHEDVQAQKSSCGRGCPITRQMQTSAQSQLLQLTHYGACSSLSQGMHQHKDLILNRAMHAWF